MVMSRHYKLRRATDQTARATEHDAAKGIVYLYVRFEDRVDVYKFTDSDLASTPLTGEELISVSAPCYRVTSGQCSCSGYTYRGKCRHSERVRRLSTSVLEGWKGAAE